MKKLILLFFITLCCYTAKADSNNTDSLWRDKAHNQEIIKKEFDSRKSDDFYLNNISFQAGYSIFNPDLGKYGYIFSGEYNLYVKRNLYVFANYAYAFSENKEEYKSTDRYMYGKIKQHTLGIGFGYDMLRINGHRLYGALGVAAGYQEYQRDLPPKSILEEFVSHYEDNWSMATIITVGYGYSFTDNIEFGISWIGYVLQPYWANTINLKLGYKF